MKLLLLVLFLFALRATRQFIWRRMDFFIPFVLGFILGLLLLPILAMGNFPRLLLLGFPIATGGIVATQTRHWFRDVIGRKDDGKDDHR